MCLDCNILGDRFGDDSPNEVYPIANIDKKKA